jgi:ribosome-binding factor A
MRAASITVREKMKAEKPSREEILSSCDAVGQDDGVDPRMIVRQSTRKKTNRKALQLCGQIARTLSCVLAYESGDDLLRNLLVESVVPAPDSTRVLVTVSLQGPPVGAAASDVLECLARACGKLRTDVAAAIHRKRVPELVFHLAGQGRWASE